ncbi:hypothetical protein SLEP1_g8410 [Rubroshorea leprosula]|uniref:Uncharacterized protein n=1 Tax=Rubroshorea leprosula TaxID=152421 RepID=A0AAV5I7P6_9ROSI|nr:hypothetical protein SLEP1_g8410 [Rubroshorea leprosula]
MSSDETLSVGGSEEVRALEYDDRGIESWLLASKRTEDEVGGKEMIEGEGEGIPSNILEIEGGGDRCYDVEVDIVFEVMGLNSDEEEEIEKLVREGGDILDIMYLTSFDVIEATELYGPSSLSEAEMDKFLGAVGGLAIPKKSRKKSKTSENVASEGEAGDKERKQLSSSLARALVVDEPRSKLKRKGSEDLELAQKKKKKIGEPEVRGDEVVEFVPRPPPIEFDPELREIGVTTHAKGKALIPLPFLQSSLFDTKNMMVAKNFINAYLPEVDHCQAREEVVTHRGSSVVKHTLEDERDSLKMILSFEERKRKMCEEKIDAQEKEIKKMKESEVELKKNVKKLLAHNAMEEHIAKFLKSGTFDNIMNLYRLPTAILAFTDCRKKVKAQYPEVDVTSITFGGQEGGVEENGESMSTDFWPKVKLRWDHTKRVVPAPPKENQPTPPTESHPPPPVE